MLNGLSDEKIVELLKSNTMWSKRACREILSRKNDFIPLLLNILDEAADDYELAVYDNNSHHIPAALLLSQMRETQAYPRLVELLDCDEDDVDYLWGDLLTEYYVWMLRDTYNGDSSLLPRLIEDRYVSAWSRAMALKAWGMHYFDGHISREEIAGFFRRLIHEVYAKKPDMATETVLSYVADTTREQQLEELIPDVKAAYDRNAIDEMLCGSYEEYVADFSDSRYLAEDTHIDNAIRELQRWQWFEGKKTSEEDTESDSDDTEIPKIGRNEPCPCGSGKKYKHCCLGII